MSAAEAVVAGDVPGALVDRGAAGVAKKVLAQQGVAMCSTLHGAGADFARLRGIVAMLVQFRNTCVLFRCRAPLDAAGMQTGQITKGLRPSWEPLVTLVGREVVGCFTWKHALELDDGQAVHAYRHIATDALLLLGEDDRAFAQRGNDGYEQITPSAALESAFRGWEDARPRPRDPDAVRALLAKHGIATTEPAA